jgi:cell division protein FtsA
MKVGDTMDKSAQEKKKRNAAAKSASKKTAPARTKRHQGNTIFALDIGTRTVVGILAEKTDSGYKLLDMETAAHEKRSMTDGQIEDIEAVAEVIKKVRKELERRHSVRLTNVCIAAAGRALKTKRAAWQYELSENKTITADDLKAAELDAVRKTEESFSDESDTGAFYCVGHSVVSLTLDGYKVSMPEGHRGKLLETEIITAFLPAYVVESLCAAVDEAGLDVAGLTLEPIAAMNAVVPKDLRLINIALCDIGAGTSDVAVSRDGSVIAYGMATTAGDEITESLMKSLLVDFNTAERIKTSSLPETEYTDILLGTHTITAEKVEELIAPAVDDLARTICSEILAANTVSPQAVFLVGGGSRLKGLSAAVAKGLGLDETRVVTGRRELMRGIIAPKTMEIGAEHATPIGIAVTSSEGISYDFTTITLNGKKIRTLDTNRLTIFELLGFGGIKPEQLIGRSGNGLMFTLNSERVTLRGTSAKPAEIILNGKAASLNTVVRKGDDVTVIPAENGENAAAYLSDYFAEIGGSAVTLFGKEAKIGAHITVNGEEAVYDREIENGDVILSTNVRTLGELLAAEEISVDVLLNGESAAADTVLKTGDVITLRSENAAPAAPPEPPVSTTEPVSETAPVNGIVITVNGITSTFPLSENGAEPIFLDIAAAFSDDPTTLLANSATITVNGKIARLDEPIRDGDVIVIE